MVPTNTGEEFLKLTVVLSTSIAGKMAIPLLDRIYQYGVPGNGTSMPTLDNVMALSMLLGVSVNDIVVMKK